MWSRDAVTPGSRHTMLGHHMQTDSTFPLCSCGCGNPVAPGKSYVHGHNWRNQPRVSHAAWNKGTGDGIKKRRTGECANCGKLRKFAGRGMCAPCYVRWRYEHQEPKECARCHRVLLPFCGGLCKSCYQIIRRDPTSLLHTSSEFSERLKVATKAVARRRERSPRWKGGRFIDDEGYVRIIRPEGYTGPCIHGGRYIHEHRYIAEIKILGRLLLRGEVVHHDDENRANNEPGNLMVFPSASAHRRYHAERFRQRRTEQQVGPLSVQADGCPPS